MISVVYKDDYCVLVTKPNNVLVHHAHYSRNKLHEKSVLQLLSNQGFTKLFPVHRIDRKTSGVLLLVKQANYVSKFQQLFTTRKIQKNYYAIVRGFTPNFLVVNSPVKGRDSKVYKNAETHLKTLQTITLEIPVKPYKSSRYSLVELQPQTGRLHQLRIHMNKISHPIIGDSKYGDKNHNLVFENQFFAPNLLLHAASLEFEHPFTKENITCQSNFPEEWISLFERFAWKNPIAL